MNDTRPAEIIAALANTVVISTIHMAEIKMLLRRAAAARPGFVVSLIKPNFPAVTISHCEDRDGTLLLDFDGTLYKAKRI